MVGTLLVSLLVSLIATSLVVADTFRRDLPSRTQAGWMGFVAPVAVGGSLAVAAGDSALYRLALAGEPSVVTVTPRQLFSAVAGAGLALSTLAVLTYGVGSRYGPLSPVAG